MVCVHGQDLLRVCMEKVVFSAYVQWEGNEEKHNLEQMFGSQMIDWCVHELFWSFLCRLIFHCVDTGAN